MPTVGGLFAGIGAMELGLERAGFETRWHVEYERFASEILAQHWPDIPNYGDITAIDWTGVERVDLVCGGFPCQDISVVGERAGLDGESSGLWTEFTRCVSEIRPRFVLVENSPALPVRGLSTILADLASLGYDAEWDCLPAAAFGAVHLRARTWILAYPIGERDGMEADPICSGRGSLVYSDWWASEPGVRRVDDGTPDRVDRLRVLGNALIPQIAEHIGRRIMETCYV